MKNKDKEQEAKNMAIWDAVATTDPTHTKSVDFGRKFTAIDAHYQIMEATRAFGPVGEGWGYQNEYSQIHLEDGRIMAVCDVTLWWTRQGEWEGNKITHHRSYGPIRGSAIVLGFDKAGKLKAPDTDAWKKASTDGLTKALSHLGFNADVFLGMFDDNKYVSELKSAAAGERTAKEAAYLQDRARFIESIKKCTKPEQIDAVLKNNELWMATLSVAIATEMRSWCMKQKSELTKTE